MLTSQFQNRQSIKTSQEYVEINSAPNTTLAIKPIYWDVIKKKNKVPYEKTNR